MKNKQYLFIHSSKGYSTRKLSQKKWFDLLLSMSEADQDFFSMRWDRSVRELDPAFGFE